MGFKKSLIVKFSEAYSDCAKILSEMEAIQYNEAKLYLATEESLTLLRNKEKELSDNYENERDEKQFSFSKIVNLICNGSPVKFYQLNSYEKYRYVKDQEKVFEQLPQQFEIWKNKMILEQQKAFEAFEYTTEEQRREKDRLDAEIKANKEALNQIMQNPDDNEVIITNYARKKLYPGVNCGFGDGTFQYQHLSIRVPNVLLYKPEEKTKKTRKIETVLEKSSLVFGDVYLVHS